MTIRVRPATEADIPAVTALVNLTYRVEDFFKVGDRTDEHDVRSHLERSGFLLAEEDGHLIGSVYVEATPPRGYFGMLSVHPDHQRRGFGRQLVAAAEAWARDHSCTEMDLSVASPRLELPPLYRKLGYHENGTAPWNGAGQTKKPAHFVLMTRTL